MKCDAVVCIPVLQLNAPSLSSPNPVVDRRHGAVPHRDNHSALCKVTRPCKLSACRRLSWVDWSRGAAGVLDHKYRDHGLESDAALPAGIDDDLKGSREEAGRQRVQRGFADRFLHIHHHAPMPVQQSSCSASSTPASTPAPTRLPKVVQRSVASALERTTVHSTSGNRRLSKVSDRPNDLRRYSGCRWWSNYEPDFTFLWIDSSST